MQQQTKKKIDEIQEMINAGVEEKEIIKLKFKSSPKAYKEWIEKFGNYLEIKNKEIIVQQERGIEEVNFIPTQKDIEKLKSLLENADDLLGLLNKNVVCDTDNINILYVPDEFLKLEDVKVSTVRLSKKIEEQFNELVAKEKRYSKTSLLNLALVEFIEKYKS